MTPGAEAERKATSFTVPGVPAQDPGADFAALFAFHNIGKIHTFPSQINVSRRQWNLFGVVGNIVKQGEKALFLAFAASGCDKP
jgi:hypothetical protein